MAFECCCCGKVRNDQIYRLCPLNYNKRVFVAQICPVYRFVTRWHLTLRSQRNNRQRAMQYISQLVFIYGSGLRLWSFVDTLSPTRPPRDCGRHHRSKIRAIRTDNVIHNRGYCYSSRDDCKKYNSDTQPKLRELLSETIVYFTDPIIHGITDNEFMTVYVYCNHPSYTPRVRYLKSNIFSGYSETAGEVGSSVTAIQLSIVATISKKRSRWMCCLLWADGDLGRFYTHLIHAYSRL